MSIIKISTEIKAPIERCFLLSLSVDLHKKSVSQTGEKAIEGIITGLMKLNDTVTWQARHFGLKLKMTTRITHFDKPIFFVSEMQKGPFKKLYHQHFFETKNGHTIMTDTMELKAPFGVLGWIAEKLFLTAYMRKFLKLRNDYIKAVAESEEWKKYI